MNLLGVCKTRCIKGGVGGTCNQKLLRPGAAMLRLVSRSSLQPDVVAPDVVRLREIVSREFRAGAEVRIGRDPGASVRLDSSVQFPLLISRCHALVWRVEGRLVIRDRSTNGTYVNGRLLQPDLAYLLEDGDMLRFGPASVRRPGDEPRRNPFQYVFVEQPDEREAEPLTGRRRRREEAAPPEALGRAMRAAERAVRRFGQAPYARRAESPSTPPEEEQAARRAKAGEAAAARAAAAKRVCTLAEAVERIREECKCSVCLGVAVDPRAVACGHVFCGPCIEPWLQRSGQCPMCRAPAGAANPVRPLDALLRDAAEPDLPEAELSEMRERREAWLARAAPKPAPAPRPLPRLIFRFDPAALRRFEELLSGQGLDPEAPFDTPQSR